MRALKIELPLLSLTFISIIILLSRHFIILLTLCYDQYLKNTIWRRVKGNDDMIGCAEVVSVSASCSRCSNLTFSSCSITYFPYGLHSDSSWPVHIYSIDTILYPYALPLLYHPYSHLKSLPKCNLSSKSKGYNIW